MKTFSRSSVPTICPRWMKRAAALVCTLTIVVPAQALTVRREARQVVAPASAASALPLRLADGIKVVDASERGAPWISYVDGVELETPETGDAGAAAALKRGSLQPVSLVSADFDEDGVPDLAVTYSGPAGGAISVSRGNLRAVYPHAPLPAGSADPGDAPFIGDARIVATPVAADLSFAGDLTGDGHQDIVVAAKGGSTLVLYSGDGRGSFARSRTVDTGATITALGGGEIDSPDGIADLAVGVTGADGNRLLVYPSRSLGLAGTPESFKQPAPPTAVAIGRVAPRERHGVLVACGNQLSFVHALRPGSDEPRRIERRKLAFSASSLALGGFDHAGLSEVSILGADGRIRVLGANADGAPIDLEKRPVREVAEDTTAIGGALVTANASSRPGDDLVIVDATSKRIAIREAAGTDIASADLDVASAPVAVLPMRLNSDGIDDLVVVRKGSAEPSFIISRPRLTFTVTNADAFGAGSLDDAISQANSSNGADMIDFNISVTPAIFPFSPLTIDEAVTIDATTQSGFMGTPIVVVNGSMTKPTTGFLINGATSVVIRGLAVQQWGNEGIAIFNSSASMVEGCYSGVDIAGSTALGNGGSGVLLSDTSTCVVGGTTAAARNVISGNGAQGVKVQNFMSTSNTVSGNYIGTTADGMSSLSNFFNGIEVVDAQGGTTIGGSVAGAGNVIAGNDASPTLSNGVYSHGFTAFVDVFGNYIGMGANGSTPIPNGVNGVLVSDSQISIGGGSAAARNVISGNSGNGVMLDGSASGAIIDGNYIGTDATGSIGFGNVLAGILAQDAIAFTIGGVGPGFGNVISGNDGEGVKLAGSPFSVYVAGNLIGTDAAGTVVLGNGFSGFRAQDNAMADLAGNTIAGSSSNGITITDNASVSISSCNIYSNSLLGIDLGNDGVTANDDQDPDTGPNNLQNSPLVTAANYDGTLHVSGTLNSTPNSSFRIEIYVSDACDGSGSGEGQHSAGTVDVSTNLTGDAIFSADIVPVGFTVTAGDVATATASLLDVPPGKTERPQTLVPYNTSEFSTCLPIITPFGPDLSVTMNATPNPVAQLGDVTYTITVSNNDAMNIANTVVLSGSTPSGTTFQSLSAPGGWSTSDPGAGGTGAYSAMSAMVLPGDNVFTLVLRINAAVPDNTVVTNTVTVSQTDPESNTANNTAMAAVTVSAAPTADMAVTVDGSPDPVGAGSEATFSITVTNNGPIDTAASLFADVPANTTFVSLSTVPGWSCETPQPGSTGSIGCSTQNLASGASATFDLVVLVDSATPAGTGITCTASVEGSLPDGNTNNNSASDTITVAPPNSADLALNLTGTPDTVALGGTLTYSIEINNNGPAAANDVVVTDALPSLVNFVSATPSAGGAVTAPAAGTSGTVTCTWAGATDPGATRTLTIVTQASTSTSSTTTVGDTASVTSSSPDPDTSNNSATTANTIEVDENMPRADVGLTMTGGTGDIVTGTFVEYLIAVSNAGPDAAEEVAVSGSTPLGTRLVSLTTPQGTIDGPAVGGSGPFTVNLGTVDAGQTITVSLIVNVLAAGGATISNSVALTSATNDPNPANNSADASATVTAGMDTLLTWDPPLTCADDCLNPPLHLQTQAVPGNATRYAGQTERLLRNSLVGYNIYRSNQPNVQASPANLFTSVPPSITSLVAGTAPGGSFFTVTAVYPNGESGATNAASGGLPQPTIVGIQFKAGKLIVNGADFNDNVTVFVDGIPFRKAAKVKVQGTRIQQKGKLLTGQSVENYIAGQGGIALISVLNEDSGIGTFLYTR